ncbi:hypothetical protein NKG05_07155 [Oerskovia sp. M15]
MEKPTVASLAEHERLVEIVEETGRWCQVGFQTYGSGALDEVRRIVASGEIGTVTGIGAVGTWVRTTGYWERAPWAGKRRIGDQDVVDGVVTNPLAHAVATALLLGGLTRADDVATVDVDLYRANPIESDDTSSVRVVGRDGTRVAAGLTLCAPERSPARVILTGTAGKVTLLYESDTVLVEVAGTQRRVQCERTDLLDNLLAVRSGRLREATADGAQPGLLCDVRDTGAFMRVLEAVRTAPDPALIGPEHVSWHGEGDSAHPSWTTSRRGASAPPSSRGRSGSSALRGQGADSTLVDRRDHRPGVVPRATRDVGRVRPLRARDGLLHGRDPVPVVRDGLPRGPRAPRVAAALVTWVSTAFVATTAALVAAFLLRRPAREATVLTLGAAYVNAGNLGCPSRSTRSVTRCSSSPPCCSSSPCSPRRLRGAGAHPGARTGALRDTARQLATHPIILATAAGLAVAAAPWDVPYLVLSPSSSWAQPPLPRAAHVRHGARRAGPAGHGEPDDRGRDPRRDAAVGGPPGAHLGSEPWRGSTARRSRRL